MRNRPISGRRLLTLLTVCTTDIPLGGKYWIAFLGGNTSGDGLTVGEFCVLVGERGGVFCFGDVTDISLCD